VSGCLRAIAESLPHRTRKFWIWSPLRYKAGDHFTVSRNGDLFPALDGTEQFLEALLGLCRLDFHQCRSLNVS
jgi:hypothetical protein